MKVTEEFIDILGSIYDPDFDFGKNHDFSRYQRDMTKEVKKKLFELEGKDQREGFLRYVFRGIFDEGKDYNFHRVYIIDQKQAENDYSPEVYNFLYNCLLLLNGLIYDVSEVASDYQIDMGDILKDSIRTGGVPSNFFVYVTIRRSKKKKITHPAKALFCRMISETKIMEIDSKDAGEFCQEVCKKYGFEYKDKVRQEFGKQPINKHFDDLRKTIIPTLNKETAQKINDHLKIQYPNK